MGSAEDPNFGGKPRGTKGPSQMAPHVHLRSCELKMAIACACLLSPQDRKCTYDAIWDGPFPLSLVVSQSSFLVSEECLCQPLLSQQQVSSQPLVCTLLKP